MFLTQTHSATLRATLRSPYTSFRSGHITRIMRKMPQLGIFPNLLHFVPQTSHNPDVHFNWDSFCDGAFFFGFIDRFGCCSLRLVFPARNNKESQLLRPAGLRPCGENEQRLAGSHCGALPNSKFHL